MAVAVSLESSECVPRTCHWGSLVDTQGLHGLVYKQTGDKIVKHHALNDVITCTFISAGIPVVKEPAGLTRLDGRRPDSLTLIPWQGGKSLT